MTLNIHPKVEWKWHLIVEIYLPDIFWIKSHQSPGLFVGEQLLLLCVLDTKLVKRNQSAMAIIPG